MCGVESRRGRPAGLRQEEGVDQHFLDVDIGLLAAHFGPLIRAVLAGDSMREDATMTRSPWPARQGGAVLHTAARPGQRRPSHLDDEGHPAPTDRRRSHTTLPSSAGELPHRRITESTGGRPQPPPRPAEEFVDNAYVGSAPVSANCCATSVSLRLSRCDTRRNRSKASPADSRWRSIKMHFACPMMSRLLSPRCSAASRRSTSSWRCATATATATYAARIEPNSWSSSLNASGVAL
jgi:hypothetical protein